MKAICYAERPDMLGSLKEIFLKRQNQPIDLFKVKYINIAKNGVFLLDLEGIEDLDSSGALIGSDVLVSQDKLEELSEGEYYWEDIIGLEVLTEDDRKIGRVESIFPTGSNDVYVVSGGEREILLPAIDEVIKKIDLEKGIVVVNLLDGL
jgi:16S rRNA processing protein RimM